MIAEIEDAIAARLNEQLSESLRILVQKGYEGIPQPAVYLSTEEGKFERSANDTARANVEIYIDIIFKSLSTEQARRKGLYKILEAIVQTLLYETLGLPIHPLQPRSFRDVTTEELLRDGLIAYSLVVETYYQVRKMRPENVLELLTAAFGYYLSPTEENLASGGTDTPAAMDLLEAPEQQ